MARRGDVRGLLSLSRLPSVAWLAAFLLGVAPAVAEESSSAAGAVVTFESSDSSGDTITVVLPQTSVLDDAEAESNSAEACEKNDCESADCDDPQCEGCEEGACGASDAVAETEPEADGGAAEAEAEENVVRPTHKQTKIIKVLTSDLPTRELKTFCMTAEGNVLAACAGDGAGDVRVFDPIGEFLTSWELPFEPEAINVGSDGAVYAAGEGALARFTLEGDPVNEGRLPHAEALLANKDALREEVVASHEQQMGSLTKYLEQIDKQIEGIEARIAKAKEAEAAEAKAEAGAEADAAEGATDQAAAAFQQAFGRLASQSQSSVVREEAMLKAMKQNRDSIQRMVDRQGGAELTEEQIEEKVKASIAYKLRVASISEADGEVFVATGAEKGYGFCVWRTNRYFENGEKIVSGLSGCCGQMDVQACCDGVFVAENGRHSVRRFDRRGDRITSWGSSARKGLEGFGGCCNPMNVAFGADGSVYTAESESGRIKRFTNEGELVDLVGKVDLVPGCKKVSIAVGPEGDRVYMLDISRNHIVLMERLEEDERVAYYEEKSGAPATAFFKQVLEAFAGD